MNREDLRWALDAVLPHAGTTKAGTDFVGLAQRDFDLVVYATDKYTMGIADIPHGPAIDVHLSVSETRDLLKFVRPHLKHEEAQEVIVLVRENELHVGLVNEDGETYDSEVYDLTRRPVSLDDLERFSLQLAAAPTEFQSCVYQPKIFGRFAKAGREDGDRLHLQPKHTNDKYGAALVTVGEHFTGAIAGMTYEEVEGKAA